MNIKSGMIGFSNNKVGLLPKLIRFFTKSTISHTFILTQFIENEPTVQEASLLVQIVPFNKYYIEDNTQSYWIYEIKQELVSKEQIDQSLTYCFKEFAGVKYGKLQLLWFPYRSLMEFFRKDVRKQKNWLSDGVICSELVFYYLYNLGELFQNLLKDFNPDTIQAEDIRQIVINNPDIFTLKECKI